MMMDTTTPGQSDEVEGSTQAAGEQGAHQTPEALEGADQTTSTEDGGAEGALDTQEQAEGSGDDGEDKGKAAAYIRQLKREKYEAIRAAEQAKREADELRRQASASAEPDPDNFDDPRQYAKAYAQWEMKQNREPASEEADGYAKALVQAGFDRADAALLADSFAEARERHQDFDTVVTTNPAITPDIVKALVAADDPGEVLHYIATTPDAAATFAGLRDPRHLAAQAARLEERMKMDALRESRKRKAGAPPPDDDEISGGGGSGRQAPGPKASSDATYSYLKELEFGGGRRR